GRYRCAHCLPPKSLQRGTKPCAPVPEMDKSRPHQFAILSHNPWPVGHLRRLPSTTRCRLLSVEEIVGTKGTKVDKTFGGTTRTAGEITAPSSRKAASGDTTPRATTDSGRSR